MNNKSLKILTLPLRLALVILIFGALFKTMHWPFAKQLMLTASILISILYAIRFINKTNKISLDYVKIAFVILAIFSYYVKAFHLFSLPYVLEILLLILFIWWFINEGIYYFKNRKPKTLKVFYYLLIGLTSFSLVFGILFKIQHWPYGALLFTLGILLLSLLLILDYFIVERS